MKKQQVEENNDQSQGIRTEIELQDYNKEDGHKNNHLSSSLIPKQQDDADDNRYKQFNFLFDEPVTLQNAPAKVIKLILSSLPNVFTQFSVTFFLFVNMYFIQQTSSPLLVGAYGLATTWYHSTCYSAIVSLNNGLFTQVSQAYGANNHKLIGHLINKALAIALTFATLAMFFILNTKNIMLSFGIKEETADLSQQFAVWLLPSLFLNAVSDCLRNSLLGIQKSQLVMNSYMLSYLMHPIWLYIFVDCLDMPIIGMSLSRGISDLNILLNLLYNLRNERKRDKTINLIIQPFFVKETFTGWIKYLKVAIPVGSVVYLEWAFFEVTTIIVGMLQDDDQLAGHTSFQCMTPFFYMMPLGLSMSVNFFLGSCIGDGKKSIALNLTKISVLACICEIFIFMGVGAILHPLFRKFLVISEDIGFYYDIVYNIYVFGYIVPDYLQCILGAILRSAGREQLAMLVYIFGFYVVGVPTAFFLTFTLDLEVAGIWYSLIIASGVPCLIFYYDIRKMDWDKCILEVRDRVALEQQIKISAVAEAEGQGANISLSQTDIKNARISHTLRNSMQYIEADSIQLVNIKTTLL